MSVCVTLSVFVSVSLSVSVSICGVCLWLCLTVFFLAYLSLFSSVTWTFIASCESFDMNQDYWFISLMTLLSYCNWYIAMMNWSALVAGWMYDIFGNYAGAFYSCGGISFLAAFLMFFVPRISLQSSRKSNQRFANLLKLRKPNHHSEVMRALFGCLWKDQHESRTSSNVQYSVIITTERVESVWKENKPDYSFFSSLFPRFRSDQDSGKLHCTLKKSSESSIRGRFKKCSFMIPLFSIPAPMLHRHC